MRSPLAALRRHAMFARSLLLEWGSSVASLASIARKPADLILSPVRSAHERSPATVPESLPKRVSNSTALVSGVFSFF